jgi:hypothetical protein
MNRPRTRYLRQGRASPVRNPAGTLQRFDHEQTLRAASLRAAGQQDFVASKHDRRDSRKPQSS